MSLIKINKIHKYLTVFTTHFIQIVQSNVYYFALCFFRLKEKYLSEEKKKQTQTNIFINCVSAGEHLWKLNKVSTKYKNNFNATKQMEIEEGRRNIETKTYIYI